MTRKISTGTLILGFVLIIIASLTQSITQVLNRSIKSLHTSVVIFYHGCMGSIGTIIAMLTYAQFSGKGLTITTYTSNQYLLLLLATAAESFSGYSSTLAYQSGASGFVSLLSYTCICYGFFFDLVFQKESFTIIELLAVFTILACTLFVSVYKLKVQKKQEKLKE